MKVQRADGRHLVVVDFPWWIGVMFFPLSAFMAVLCVAGAAEEFRRPGRWAWQGVGAVVAFAGAVVFTKRSWFDFDLERRELTWSRRGLLGRRGGRVAFDAIRSVNLECIRGGPRAGGPCYRVVLHTTDGGVVALTEAYGRERGALGYEDVRRAVVAAIGGKATGVEEDVAELVRAGRSGDAALMTGVR